MLESTVRWFTYFELLPRLGRSRPRGWSRSEAELVLMAEVTGQLTVLPP
jgi:hypothetical protein